MALACAALALWLAAHRPLSPAVVLAGVTALTALAAWRPLWAPVLLLGLLPRGWARLARPGG